MDERDLSVQEAAAACRVSDDTIYRRIKSGVFPNARQDAGAWRVPLADLIRAGLRPSIDEADWAAPVGAVRSAQTAQAELQDMRETLTRVLARAHAAEALAAARAEHIDDLRSLLGRRQQLALFEDDVVGASR